MPKDNEVDEKVPPVAWIVTNGGESCEPWLEYEQSEVDALPAVCIAEPLYSAATVTELRAEVERLRDALDSCREAGNKHVQRRCQMDDEIERLIGEKTVAERRVVELEALLAAIRLYAQHDDACGDMDAYNNATIESCGCGLDSLLDASSEALTGADPT